MHIVKVNHGFKKKEEVIILEICWEEKKKKETPCLPSKGRGNFPRSLQNERQKNRYRSLTILCAMLIAKYELTYLKKTTKPCMIVFQLQRWNAHVIGFHHRSTMHPMQATMHPWKPVYQRQSGVLEGTGAPGYRLGGLLPASLHLPARILRRHNGVGEWSFRVAPFPRTPGCRSRPLAWRWSVSQQRCVHCSYGEHPWLEFCVGWPKRVVLWMWQRSEQQRRPRGHCSLQSSPGIADLPKCCVCCE